MSLCARAAGEALTACAVVWCSSHAARSFDTMSVRRGRSLGAGFTSRPKQRKWCARCLPRHALQPGGGLRSESGLTPFSIFSNASRTSRTTCALRSASRSERFTRARKSVSVSLMSTFLEAKSCACARDAALCAALGVNGLLSAFPLPDEEMGIRTERSGLCRHLPYSSPHLPYSCQIYSSQLHPFPVGWGG